jgi:hypothetical protein
MGAASVGRAKQQFNQRRQQNGTEDPVHTRMTLTYNLPVEIGSSQCQCPAGREVNMDIVEKVAVEGDQVEQNVSKRIDRRLELFVGAVREGKLSPRWNDDENPSLVSNLSSMRSWLWGHIKAILELKVPIKSVIAEHLGRSPGKAWLAAETAGGSWRAAVVLEAIMKEFDFARPGEGPAQDGPLAEIRSAVWAALQRGRVVPMRAFPALAMAAFVRDHAGWLARLDRSSTHKVRRRDVGRPERSENGPAAREAHRVGSLGFAMRDGVIRPRLDLLVRPLHRLIGPLYATVLAGQPLKGKWTDIAELIRLFRNRRPYLPSDTDEFPDLTADHVRLAAGTR